MSLLKKVKKIAGKVFKPLAKPLITGAATIFGGPAVGAAVGGTIPSLGGIGAVKPPTIPPLANFAGFPVAGMSSLPRVLPAAGAVIAGGAAVAGRSAASIARAALHWCRKNPAWCASIGGTVAVEALVRNGQLPVPKRRRARGISASELKAFRRVASIVRQHAPTARKVPCKPRGKVCR